METNADIGADAGAHASGPVGVKVREALVRQLFDQSGGGLVGTLVAAVVLVAALRDVVPHWNLFLWLGAYIVVQAFRLAQIAGFRNIRPVGKELVRRGRWFVFGTIVSALLWGLSAVFLFPADSLQHQFLLALFLGGLSAAGCAVYSPLKECFVPATLVMLPPLAARYIYEGTEFGVTVGAVVLLFAVVIIYTGRRIHLALVDSLRLSLEKSDLAESLEAARAEMEDRVEERTLELVRANKELQREIRERVSAEKERLRLVTAIEQSAESIIITDTAGTIQYVNPSFERITGFSRDEAVGSNPRILNSGAQDGFFYKSMWDALTQGKVWSGRFVNRKKDGTLFLEDATISPVKDESGAVVNYVAVKRDVTNEVALEDHLRQAQKLEAIGTLAGGIAHDFNNILYAIMGYSELALDDAEQGSQLESNLQDVLKATNRARDLVSRILTFSRQTEHEQRPIRITPIVKEVVKFLRASIPSTIELRQRIESDSDPILADPTQIHQVLMNLCTNASQAMRKTGGVLMIGLETVRLEEDFTMTHADMKPGDHLMLTVSDTGAGIAPEIIDRVFEPYFTTKPKEDGTGLGLAVAHGIVKSHGGTIAVESEPGKGTVFRVYFPVLREASPPSDILPEPVGPVGAERILFVDDEPTIVDMGKQMLGRWGHQVETSTGSEEALALFREKPDAFDLVITDMTMPHMTGIELIQEIRNVRNDIPIILCTGFSELIDEEYLRSLGVNEIVLKPILKNEMVNAIKRACGR